MVRSATSSSKAPLPMVRSAASSSSAPPPLSSLVASSAPTKTTACEFRCGGFGGDLRTIAALARSRYTFPTVAAPSTRAANVLGFPFAAAASSVPLSTATPAILHGDASGTDFKHRYVFSTSSSVCSRFIANSRIFVAALSNSASS
ncbi:uncharacterized protein LOC107495988 [Arachis duranensis]|uniref:Uncharacterized protein LOC107495988 n=1 Tax=Arachis duranensis TaxID=130453 RepID=A0A9C6U1C3_ARADU|nr:uncharacterized protein LOC107495988 [Arachis duranensis]